MQTSNDILKTNNIHRIGLKLAPVIIICIAIRWTVIPLTMFIFFQSCSKRKRSAGAHQLTNTDDRVLSTAKMLHIVPGTNSAITSLGKAAIIFIKTEFDISNSDINYSLSGVRVK